MIHRADADDLAVLRSNELMKNSAVDQQFVGPPQEAGHVEVRVASEILWS